MKKLLSASLGLLVTASILQAQTIAQWTFETSVPATAGPFAPEVGSGSASGSHAGAAVYSSPSGNGSTHSFSANTWAVGDFYLFEVNTLGFNNVGLSFDQASSNTGPRDYSLDYSLNSGLTWTTVTAYSVLANAAPNTTWTPGTYVPAYTFSPALPGAVDNQASVWFRLIDIDTTSANGGTVGTGGTDRVDNFTVAVPEPTSLSLLGGFGLLAWQMIRRRK